MGRTLKKTGVLIRCSFRVWDNTVSPPTPKTGLLDASFTKLLEKDGVDDATAVTITEIATGRYQATFTASSAGHWGLDISHPTWNVRGWSEDFDVTEDGAFSINDIFDKTDGVETGVTLRKGMRACAAGAAGKSSGTSTQSTIRSIADDADRIVSTVDANGHRTAVTLNL